VYLNVIDQCGPPPGGYDAHFDISPPAFRELFGDAGVNAGVQSANWQFVDASNCRGNKGSGPTPPPTPRPEPPAPRPPSVSSSIRCGFSWTDANSKCGTPCTNDSPCGGQRCYADLSLSPCGRAVGEEDSNFSDQIAIDAAVADFVDITDPVETVDNAVVETIEPVDNAVVDTVETVVAEPVDAAVGDASFDSVGTFVDAPVEENIMDSVSFDAAVGDTVSTNTQQTQTTNLQGWAVALVVLFSVIIVLLIVVVIMVAAALRRQV
jgi:hypothetical protein